MPLPPPFLATEAFPSASRVSSIRVGKEGPLLVYNVTSTLRDRGEEKEKAKNRTGGAVIRFSRLFLLALSSFPCAACYFATR